MKTFCIARYEVLVPYGESLDLSPIKREFLRFIHDKLGISFTRDENGEWRTSAAS